VERIKHLLNTIVADIKVFDQANEFRIEILGRFAGEVVDHVKELWKTALGESSPRRFSVDISGLTGYDVTGCRLLRDIYRHGTYISARNAVSLAFLNEISAPTTGRPTLVRPSSGIRRQGNGKASVTSIAEVRHMAAGK
jgi:hypothetical protein